MKLNLDKIKISVVIPTYNRKKYLECSIRSVVKQSLKPHEIIIIDDGSTDGTDFYIKKLQDKYQNILYFYQKNSGAGAARNRGIKESTGNIIAFLDSDDTWSEDHLDESIGCIKKYKEVAVVFSKYEVVVDVKNSIDSDTLKKKYEKRDNLLHFGEQVNSNTYLLHKEACLEAELMEKVGFSTSTMVLCMNRLKCIYTFDNMIKTCQDVDFRCQMMFNQEQIAYINKIHSRYVYHDSNSVANKHDSIPRLYEKQKKVLPFYLKSMIYCKTSKQQLYRQNKISSHFYLLGLFALELGEYNDALEKHFRNSLTFKLNFNALKHLVLYKVIGLKYYMVLHKIKSRWGRKLTQ